MTARTLNFQIPAELERIESVIATATPQRHTMLRHTAERLTRRGVMAAKCELANTALVSFVEILFDTDSDDVYANLDRDNRILIPAPFGRAGGRLWGLRSTEQRAFSWLMRARSAQSDNPLFVYDGEFRQWFVGAGYGRRAALAYCRALPIQLAEWRQAWAATRSAWSREFLGND